ncbi:MAG: diacylglycerol kinase family protein [Microbacterium sp.]
MDTQDSSRPRVAVVVNPSKFPDPDTLRVPLTRQAHAHGWAEPLWFETASDDGGAQAIADAIAQAPDLVCVAGGDGTVRTAAGALRRTGIPLGILPSGTGNLLARNLQLPVGELADAIEVALVGQQRAIDVGLVSFDDRDAEPFVVMAGAGFDAAVMDRTDDALKQRIGWAAYVAAAGSSLLDRPFGTTVHVDGVAQDPAECMMVIACNCSAVMGGIPVAAGAKLDDALLDLVALSPKPVAGWLGVAMDVAFNNRDGKGSLQQWAGREFDFALDREILAEIDGDAVGIVTRGRATIDPASLLVRLPVPARTAALGTTR